MSPLLLVALLGCTDKADDTGGVTGDVTVSGVAPLVSDDVPTVVTVVFDTDVEAQGYVEFTTDFGTFQTSLTAPGTSHSVPILGVPANNDIAFQVVPVLDGVEGEPTAVQTVTNGSLPSVLPGLTQSVAGDHDSWMITPIIGATTGPVVIDPQGEIVWWHVDDRGLDSYRARITHDGTGIIYSAASVSGDPSADSALVIVPWAGGSETVIDVPLLAHDFVLLPGGGIVAIAVEYGDGPEGELRGDKLVEIQPDGTQSDIWSAWDCFDPAEVMGDDEELGWTFVNALDYSEEDDAFYVGIRNFSSIAKVDRATGACEWVVGTDGATIDIEGERFRHQHQFEVEGDMLLVFDNEGAGGVASRAIEYELDIGAGTATEVWNYEPSPSIFSFVLGDVHRYDDGDTFVTWSVAGQLDRITADGTPEWTVNTDLGYAFGFMSLYESLYE